MKALPITELSVVKAASDQVSCMIKGEAVILNLRDGLYYGLDVVGARIWDLIQEPQPVSTIADALLAEFDVEPEVCQRELIALLNELAQAGMVIVT